MANNVKIDKKKLYTNINNVDIAMKSLANEIKKLSNNINAMMKGNADGPYWNGTAANRYYDKAIDNLKNDIADYKAAYNQLFNISDKYQELVWSDNPNAEVSISTWRDVN